MAALIPDMQLLLGADSCREAGTALGGRAAAAGSSRVLHALGKRGRSASAALLCVGLAAGVFALRAGRRGSATAATFSLGQAVVEADKSDGGGLLEAAHRGIRIAGIKGKDEFGSVSRYGGSLLEGAVEGIRTAQTKGRDEFGRMSHYGGSILEGAAAGISTAETQGKDELTRMHYDGGPLLEGAAKGIRTAEMRGKDEFTRMSHDGGTLLKGAAKGIKIAETKGNDVFMRIKRMVVKTTAAPDHEMIDENRTVLKTAAAPKAAEDRAPRPRLMCWSHIEQSGYERDLITSQLKARVSIFTCNDFLVISRGKYPIMLGPLPANSSPMVYTAPNDLPPDHRGNTAAGDPTASFMNAFTFIMAWEIVMRMTETWRNDWVVKVDPDAVFYPDRLRRHVEDYTKPPRGPGPYYYLNCDIDGGQLFGALEVVSVLALKVMSKRGMECRDLPYHRWGEDLYLRNCMEMLNGAASAIRDYSLVGDGRCVPAPCTDSRYVAFHPMKDADQYWGCLAQSK